ncbi:hypothetical protein T10_10305 [Trichinella papuae]|uniref:Uncharacterized protein n=1 Tax=Trichinella papuae TaxID=268474 RepID=A0A0V1N3X7_9BILA|nr:hypothetical protein T10_10305 [Trichinella papuae]
MLFSYNSPSLGFNRSFFYREIKRRFACSSEGGTPPGHFQSIGIWNLPSLKTTVPFCICSRSSVSRRLSPSDLSVMPNPSKELKFRNSCSKAVPWSTSSLIMQQYITASLSEGNLGPEIVQPSLHR